MKGALERPNGNTVNWKYLTQLVPKCHENAKNDPEKYPHGGIQIWDQKKKQNNLERKYL